jgi:hypothetical protein
MRDVSEQVKGLHPNLIRLFDPFDYYAPEPRNFRRFGSSSGPAASPA